MALRTRWLVLAAALALLLPAAATGEEATTPGQVYGLVMELSDEIDSLRAELGHEKTQGAAFVVSNAQPREVFFQAVALLAKARRYSLEQLDELGSPVSLPDREESNAADVYKLVEAALERVRAVSDVYQVERAQGEGAQHPGKRPSDVYHAILAANRQLAALLDRRFALDDAHGQVAYATTLVASMLGRIPSAQAVERPALAAALEAGKQPGDAHGRLLECVEVVRQISESLGAAMLRAEPSESAGPIAASDVYDLASVLVSELAYLHDKLGASEVATPDKAEGHTPADVFQGANLLHAQLSELGRRVAHNPASPSPSPPLVPTQP